MKLKEIANTIDKTEKNECYICFCDMLYSLDLGYETDMLGIEQSRLKCYWIKSWFDIDTVVGYRMYFLDGFPVCISTQTHRRSKEIFSWFSIEDAIMTRDCIIDIATKNNKNFEIDVVDINIDFSEYYE